MHVRLVCRSLRALLTLAVLAGPAPAAPTETPEKHWAFQPVQRPALPLVRDRAWVRTPLDAFVRASLEKQGLHPAPPADRNTLLRRVYFDLIGLPPTPAEQHAFLADPSPDAFARVVDDLLARPQYGERWGRHWLDVARYADTNGYERDGAKPHAWRYRDYVIDAFNKDKPYDRFVREQVAGDEMENSSAEAQIAATFLRLGTWDDEPAEPMMDRYDQLDDVLGTTAAAFLGVTLRCARCHDHKFEPFTQADYYRMLAVFEPLKRPQFGRTDLDRAVGNAAELAAHEEAKARADTDSAALKKEIVALEQKNNLRPDEKKEQRERLEKRLAAIKAAREELPLAYVWYESGPKAPVTHVLHRGDPTRPRQVVEPGLPEILQRHQQQPPRPLAHSTGRRLWLATWLTRSDNPLVARVMVNRVWQHHFGRGLVGTANDFGVMGDPPTHPELLDWLTAEFVARGWSLKALHRLIVLSNTYQMADTGDPKAAILSRWRQQRLEAEAVRDSILAVSGQLNPRMGGPGTYPPLPPTVLAGQSRPGDGWGKSDTRELARRSIYIFVKRSLAVPELEVLDAPDTTSSCDQRIVSTIAPQALTFLNGDFVNQQTRHFAERLQREAGADATAQVGLAFELALCRPARAEEVEASVAFLAVQERQIEKDGTCGSEAGRKALAAFCLVLLNTNEFVYVK